MNEAYRGGDIPYVEVGKEENKRANERTKERTNESANKQQTNQPTNKNQSSADFGTEDETRRYFAS